MRRRLSESRSSSSRIFFSMFSSMTLSLSIRSWARSRRTRSCKNSNSCVIQQSQGISTAQDSAGRSRCQVPGPQARTSCEDNPKIRDRWNLHDLQNCNLIDFIHHISHILNESLKAGVFGGEANLLGMCKVGEEVDCVAVPVGDDWKALHAV